MKRHYRPVTKRPVRRCYCGTCPACEKQAEYLRVLREFFSDTDRRDGERNYYDGKTNSVET